MQFSAKGDIMTQVIEAIEQAYKNKILIKSRTLSSFFLIILTQKKDLQEMVDLATYSVSIGFYEES